MSSATSGIRLAAAHLRSGITPSLLVAAVVAVSAFLVVAAPFSLARVADADLQERLAALSFEARSLRVTVDRFPSSVDASGQPTVPGESAEVWFPITVETKRLLSRLPSPLSRAVGSPLYTVTTKLVTVRAPSGSVGIGTVADPEFDERVRWIAGTAPDLASAPPGPDPTGRPTDWTTVPPMPVGLSSAVAAALKVSVGTVLTRSGGRSLVVSGIFQPQTTGATLWRVQPLLLRTGILAGERDAAPIAYGVVSPRSPGLRGLLPDAGPSVLIPIRSDAWTAAESAAARRQLNAFSSAGISITGADPAPFTTAAIGSISAAQRAAAGLAVVTALLAAGPAGVVLLVIGLGITFALDRRRPAIRAGLARGASAARVGGAAAAEGALFGLPAAGLGALGASLVFRSPIPAPSLTFVLVLGLAPAVAGVLLAVPVAGESGRRDLGSGRPAPWRLPVEGGIVVLAGALTASLLLRGPAQDAETIDPLLVVSPLLLAVAAGVITLRGYPLALRIAQRALHRGRGAMGFLGVARGVREPTVRLSGALAILTAVSVGVLAATVYVSVDTATRADARTSIGADIAASVVEGTVRRAPRLPGVRVLATLAEQAPVEIDHLSIDVVTATTGTLHLIRHDIPALTERRDGAIPILTSSDLPQRIGTHVVLSGHSAVIVGHVPSDVDYGPQVNWILVDRSLADGAVDTASLPTLLLATVDSGRSSKAIASRLRAALPSTAIVRDAETQYDEVRSASTVRGLQGGIFAVTGTAAALSVLVAIMSVVAATRRRDRTVALLRVLGLSRPQNRRMLVAELAPIAVALTVVGIGLGYALAVVVISVVDLRSFTGGTLQPSAVFEPAPLAAIGSGFLVLASTAAAIAAHTSSRVRPADVIRTGD